VSTSSTGTFWPSRKTPVTASTRATPSTRDRRVA
jgi:hypothetical protein